MTEPFSLVIFGVTGNLSQIKLLPALYDLEKHDLLPPGAKIVGVSRQSLSSDEFINYLSAILHQENRHHPHPIDDRIFSRLAARLSHISGTIASEALYQQIKSRTSGHRIFYLATYPSLYAQIFSYLNSSGLNTQGPAHWTRIVVEKPLGNDLPSARALDELLLSFFVEDQIYRLDHYLGKETLQNIITFRFGNGIFEPLMNAEYIDHIQLTAGEDFGIGKRGAYYDSVGALKDVGQNHILQILALVLMEDPIHFTNAAITQKRIDLLRRLIPDPRSVVFGQYAGYTSELNVDPASTTDTFFAFTTGVSGDRFRGVPIYVRAGKKLTRTVTEVNIVFKLPRNRIFKEIAGGLEPNGLIYRFQPNEGIVLKILTKTPGHAQSIEPTFMQFCYRHLKGDMADPYEKLLLDVLRGDQTFFNDAPEVEAQWAFTDKLFSAKTQPIPYLPGSWGPDAAHALLTRDHRSWIEPSAAFCQF